MSDSGSRTGDGDDGRTSDDGWDDPPPNDHPLDTAPRQETDYALELFFEDNDSDEAVQGDGHSPDNLSPGQEGTEGVRQPTGDEPRQTSGRGKNSRKNNPSLSSSDDTVVPDSVKDLVNQAPSIKTSSGKEAKIARKTKGDATAPLKPVLRTEDKGVKRPPFAAGRTAREVALELASEAAATRQRLLAEMKPGPPPPSKTARARMDAATSKLVPLAMPESPPPDLKYRPMSGYPTIGDDTGESSSSDSSDSETGSSSSSSEEVPEAESEYVPINIPDLDKLKADVKAAPKTTPSRVKKVSVATWTDPVPQPTTAEKGVSVCESDFEISTGTRSIGYIAAGTTMLLMAITTGYYAYSSHLFTYGLEEPVDYDFL